MADASDHAQVPAGEVGIGAAAAMLGTTVRALRHYEQRGLLSPTSVSQGGHRRYGDPALQRARRLLAMRTLGLSLDEIRDLLSEPAPAGLLVSVLRAQDDRLRTEIDQMAQTRERIAQVLARHENTDQPDRVNDEAFDLLEEISMSIVLSRIYTRTGDDGTTGLVGAQRVDKTEPILDVIGDVDELIAVIGVARALGETSDGDLLVRIQNDLFDVGAELAGAPAETGHAAVQTRVSPDYVSWLETQCDSLIARLQPAQSFVVPGGASYPAALHQARSVCRRAERNAWRVELVSDTVRQYLNRLSDLLFLLARTAEPTSEDLWEPGAHSPR